MDIPETINSINEAQVFKIAKDKNIKISFMLRNLQVTHYLLSKVCQGKDMNFINIILGQVSFKKNDLEYRDVVQAEMTITTRTIMN